MSEYDDLVLKLQQQQKALLFVIAEAEEKIKIFWQTIEDGKKQLGKVTKLLQMMGLN